MCTEVSDSQVSDLYPEDVLDEIKSHVNINLDNILEEEILPDEKYEMKPDSSLDMNLPMNPENHPSLSVNIPITEEFSGISNFEIICNPGKGKYCVYSQELRKIFIDMEHRLTLRIKWDPPMHNLWLRTSLVYSEDQDRGTPVRRCHNHMATTGPSNQNVSAEILRQVVRCVHPHSSYEEINGHMTVSVPLQAPPTGCDYILLDFSFHCKNSCSSGMNRRATQLIFTLETNNYEIIGRRNLKVRVCSCPKRDKEKEETETLAPASGIKRKSNSSKILVAPGKKLMMPNRQSSNSPDVNLLLRLPDKELAQDVLWDVYKNISARAVSDNVHKYSPYLEEIKLKINAFKNF